MTRTTQRIRRLTQSRRPRGRSNPDARRRPLRAMTPRPLARRYQTLVRPLPGSPPARPPRRRSRALRLVVNNAHPIRGLRPKSRPELRLIRGRAPMLAVPRRPPTPVLPRKRPAETSSRLGQLVFVLTMAAIGLAALATSVGQILQQRM
ncbi:MAG TPA: hypothetical protein VIS07_05985 [Candidatus Binatia bacterium]